MRRADWLTLLAMVALGATSLSLIVAAFLATGNAANLLMGLGITLAVGCMLVAAQVFYTVARERQLDMNQHASTSGSLAPERSPSDESTSMTQQLTVAPTVEVQRQNTEACTLYRAVSAAPSKSELVTQAQDEVLAMVVSGRNFFQPQLHNTILEKIKNPADKTVFRLLMLNHFSASHFVDARAAMMDMRRGTEFQPVYEQDFDTVREYSAQVTIEDPTRERFDVRFYSHMPTAYFYIIDGVLYISFLLSKPISSSPLIIVKPIGSESLAVISAFRSHFEHYWKSSRFFVTLIGLTDNGQTVLVRNRKRGLEWPTGFIEPNEDLATGAAREFEEETGYKVGLPIQLAKTPMGYFFVARVGEQINNIAAREVSEAIVVRDLPERSTMSFNRDYAQFVRYLEQARNMISELQPPH